MTNWLMRLVGLGEAVDALDGEKSKTYAGGVGLILAGAASILGGLAGIAGQIVAAHGGADYLALVKGIPHNASAGLILAGYAGIKQGLAVIGARHAIAKATKDATVPPADGPK